MSSALTPVAGRRASEPRATGSRVSVRWAAITVTVAVVAFVARLRPVLAGAGLRGLGNYDDGVYFGASVAFVHGRIPYRDFLLLHPPGIVLALAPFAVFGRLTSEGTGFAAARIAFMALGAINAVLVARILRPVSLSAAVLGGLGYALFYPAVYVEQTTMLEGLGNTCLLVAVLLLTRGAGISPRSTRALVAAGAVLGLSASIKIWGLVAILLVFGWLSWVENVRRAVLLLAGAAVAIVVVCGPFFLADPSAMREYVVTAQLGRSRGSTRLAVRLSDILGLHLHPSSTSLGPLLSVALVVSVALTVLACREPRMRLAVVLAVGLAVFLLASPTWFVHYSGLTAPPAALVFGAAGQQLMHWSARWTLHASTAMGAALLLILLAYAAPLRHASFGKHFAGAALRSAVSSRPGCVTADDPAALVELNVLGRDVDRHCPLVIDSGGYSYVLGTSHDYRLSRNRDKGWQEHTLTYLRSGTAAIVVRYKVGGGFSAATGRTISRWPVLRQVGADVLRIPRP